MAKKKGTWEQQILNQIQEEERVTYLGKNHPELDPDEHPNFKVFEFTPNRHLDGNNRYYLSGPNWSIMQQASHVKALHDLLANRLGYGFTFEDWWKQWEAGFTFGINRTGTTGLKTNYPFKKVGDIPGWRTDKTTRPGYLEWKSPNAKANPYYRVIEYWPDRSVNKSYVLSGSDTQVIQQILQIEYENGGSIVTGEGEKQPNYKPEIRFGGLPTVLLYFRELEEDVEKGYAAIQAEIRFHLVGKSADPDSSLSLLTVGEVQELAKRIQAQFVAPTPYRIHKGKETVSVKDKENGLDSYLHCYNETEGIQFYTKLYAAMGKTMSNDKLYHTENKNPSGAFPTVPGTVKILGTTVKRPRRRPVGYCYFRRAKLFIKQLKEPILLCDSSGYLFRGLDESQSSNGDNSSQQSS